MYSGSTAVTVNGIDANERTTPPAAALKLRRARGQRAREATCVVSSGWSTLGIPT
jgi:hypothetical protein